jgi:hypothetical protein
LILAEEDIKVLKDELAALRKAQAENPEPARQEAVEKPTLEAGQKAVQDANLARPDQVDSDVSGSDGVGLGLTGLTSEAPGELATEEVTESVPEPVPEAESEVALRPADDQARGRLTLRAMENKAAFGNEVVLSLVDLNSIDLEITLRIRYAKSGRREAHLMSPGDLIEIKIDDTLHTIYLDQIRGNMAFFILDGLPKEPTT